MDETLFYVFGIALAVLAVVVSFIGIRSEKFPGKAAPVVIVLFLGLAGAAATFAVLHAQEEHKHTAEKYKKANEEIEAEEEQQHEDNEAEEGASSEGGGEMESESGSEGEMGMSGSAEAGAVVFTSAGCSSCHTFAAAESSGVTGPNLNETLAADDSKESIEEMIVDPNKEIVPGYSEGIMPTTFGESLSEEELANVVEFLYVNSPAGEGS